MATGFSLAKQIKNSKALHGLLKPVATLYANLAGYRSMGLRYDDLIPEENDVMQTSLKRLSEKETYDRVYRLRRAQQASLQHQLLPPHERTTPETDVRYLKNIFEQAEAEKKEREEWDSISVKRK